MADMKLALVISALDRATRPLQQIGRSVAHVGERAQAAGRGLRNLGGQALTRATLPLSALGGVALNAAGQIEQMEVAFGSMTGSAEAGRRVVQGLVDFAAATPFQLTGIGDATRQLLAAGVGTNDLKGELQVLGDIAAGAQVPLGDLAQIYAKGLSKGKVQTEELNQLAERGIPILDALVDLAGDYGNEISKEDVYEAAQKGEISFRTLREALAKLTEEGGVFNDQMEKQSQTLFGLGSTLKDNVFLGLARVGKKIVEITNLRERMKAFTARIQQAVVWFDTFAEERPGLTKLIFGLTAAAAVMGPALLALGVIVGGVGVGITAIGTALAFVASPIALAVAAIGGAALLIRRNWDGVVGFFERLWVGVQNAFPGAAAFFQGLWDRAATPVAGIFDWVSDAWDSTVAWIRRPTTDIFDGLTAAGAVAAAGAFFGDVQTAFAALDWADLGLSLGTTVVGGIAALAGLVADMNATIATLDWTGIGSTIGDAISGFITGRIAMFAGLVEGMTRAIDGFDFSGLGNVIGDALSTRIVAVAGALTGLLAALAATVRGIDFGEVGKIVGRAIGAAIRGAISLRRGIIESLKNAATDGSLAEAAKALGKAILDGIAAALAGLKDFIAGLVEGALEDTWLGGLIYGDKDKTAPISPAAVPAFAGPLATTTRPEPSLLSTRNGADSPSQAEVNGEIRVYLDNLPEGSRVERISSEGGVDLTADLGYAMEGG